jgi:hypothetical protein
MPKHVLRLGVIARSHPPANQWAERTPRPFAVMPELPPLARGALMGDHDGVQTHYLGDHALVLHSGETGHYRDNLSAARPSVWVVLDGGAVMLVTVDPYEGEALASDPMRMVEALPMPPAVQAAVAAFIDAHHVEEPFVKRRRTPGAPVADPRAPRVLSTDQKWSRR